MEASFKIVSKNNYDDVVSLVEKLNDYKISKALLTERFEDMKTQNHECAGIYIENELIGICGLWYCTRHYSGKSVELDHVFIDEAYRSKGLGKQFLNWISDYVKSKDVETIELNTYTQNHASHKFYYNEGFNILGFHFLKKM